MLATVMEFHSSLQRWISTFVFVTLAMKVIFMGMFHLLVGSVDESTPLPAVLAHKPDIHRKCK